MKKLLLKKTLIAIFITTTALFSTGCMPAVKVANDKPEFLYPYGKSGPKYRCNNWHLNGTCQHLVRADGDALISINTN